MVTSCYHENKEMKVHTENINMEHTPTDHANATETSPAFQVAYAEILPWGLIR